MVLPVARLKAATCNCPSIWFVSPITLQHSAGMSSKPIVHDYRQLGHAVELSRCNEESLL